MRPCSFLLVLLAFFGTSSMLVPAIGHAQINSHSILLVASTRITDPRFKRTVVLVTRHGRSPPLGVIINRPLDANLGTLFPNLPEAEKKRLLFFGGPVSTDMLAFLFRSQKGSPDAIRIGDGTHLGRSSLTLSELLRGPRTHTGLRVFAGYSGWAENQLEAEISRGDWHVLPVDEAILFDRDNSLIWPELIRRATQQSVQLPFFFHFQAQTT